MSIPKKGSRLNTVDGVTYRWRIRRKPTYCQANSWGPLTFAVEPTDGPRRVLLVLLPCSRPDARLGERAMAVRPALVSAAIRKALDHGWDPHQTGNAFTLRLTEDDLTEAMNGQPPSYAVSFMRR
ncbi:MULTISPECIES: hypothetical protein [unclassified Nonomuraea]|uniref:hypothetical protein n=1 Tax=unclassified Nonomuraea TaxID=2593643 RepID=UPI0033FB00AB